MRQARNVPAVESMLEVLTTWNHRGVGYLPQAYCRDVVWGGLVRITDPYARLRVAAEVAETKSQRVGPWCVEALGEYGGPSSKSFESKELAAARADGGRRRNGSGPLRWRPVRDPSPRPARRSSRLDEFARRWARCRSPLGPMPIAIASERFVAAPHRSPRALPAQSAPNACATHLACPEEAKRGPDQPAQPSDRTRRRCSVLSEFEWLSIADEHRIALRLG